MSYIAIQNGDETETYQIDTLEQIETAQAAMRAAGVERLPVWHGDPDDPDSYQDSVRFLSAE